MDDLGTLTADPVDYPDTAARVAKSVARGEADAGIVIDGAGIGSAIAANKIAGVRAAVCHDQTMARYARQHNGANVLSLGLDADSDEGRARGRRRVAEYADDRAAVHPEAREDSGARRCGKASR